MELNDSNTFYSSYTEYKFMTSESKLQHLIRTKYLKMLGEFIESMYSGLRFDIFIKDRNPKERRAEWYGMTFMELVVFDIISLPSYSPRVFSEMYKTPHYDGYISGEILFNDIDSYIPEINKHLLISFVPHVTSDGNEYGDFYNLIAPYECWKEHFYREHVLDAVSSSKGIYFFPEGGMF